MRAWFNGRWCLLVVLLAIGSAAAQQQVVPLAGQTAEQQRSDEAACYSRAVDQSGFDPEQPADDKPRSELRGATRGAVVSGVIRGEAAAGAALGAALTKVHNRRQSKTTQQHQDAFDKARAACLEARAYRVN